MKWNRYTIKTTTEAEDYISSMLMDLGIEGIEIQDNVPLSQEDKKQMFVDILPILEEEDETAYISFYLDEGTDCKELLENVEEGLKDLKGFLNAGECTIVESQTEDKDWINNWKQYFKQFTVDDILIKPSWEEVKEEDKNKLMIQIDPGTAFGTGMHETTQLCIRQLKKYITPATNLFDVGCGSGILSIAGLKLGAIHAYGLDIDPNAIPVAMENAQVNQLLPDQYEFLAGNLIEDTKLQGSIGLESFDIVVSNILADILVALTPVVKNYVKKGGYYITSGILNTKEELVAKAVRNNGFEIEGISYQGEWVCITARKM